jgi:hypothetical protein
MQRIPIRSITLHALAVVAVTIGLALAAVTIMLLTVEAQPIDVAVFAGLRALWSYILLLGALLGCGLIGAAGALAVQGLASTARRRHGVR